jgi:DNA-binding CsgD family transcriptional regulator
MEATPPDILAVVDDRATREAARLPTLSVREYEILSLLAEGLTGAAIAERLFLSPETVRTHIRNAARRLGAQTRVQAVAILVRGRTLESAPAPRAHAA